MIFPHIDNTQYTLKKNIKNEHKKLGHPFSWLATGDGNYISLQLEQLECLHSEDIPRRLMITHTIESYGIPSKKKKTKSKLQI